MWYLPSFLFFIVMLTNCSPEPSEQNPDRAQLVQQQAQAFFDTYAERSDWEKFCSFYREDMQFHDVILQLHLDSLWQLKRFYQWDSEGDQFQKLSPDQEHLAVESLVANDSVAVARGRVNPFYYSGHLIDVEWGMDFTIWLHFDDSLRITKQIDWMEYDPAVLENMLKRVQENGHEAIPNWLDLSQAGS